MTTAIASKLLTTAATLAQASSDCLAAADALMAGAAPGASGPTQPAPAAGDPNFPADPATAPFPSPENATSVVLAGKVSGAPYLRSKNGAIYQILADKPLSNQYGAGYQMAVNGQPCDPGMFVTQVVVRQGDVYFAMNNAGFGIFEAPDAITSGVQRTALPPPWTTTAPSVGGQTVSLPPMPAAPPFVMPALTKRTISFDHTQASLQAAHDAAQPGDTIFYSGPGGLTASLTLAVTKPIVVDFGGRTTNAGTEGATYTPGLTLDVSSLDDPTGYPHQLGAIVPMTDCIVRGLRCTSAGMKEQTHGGTAAIRMGAPGNLMVDHCDLEKNQNGIGPSGFAHTIVATNTILRDNGLGVADGGSHNVYASSACVSAQFGPGFTSIVTQGGGGGHALKSRANVTTLVAPFFLYSADASSLDLPDGSSQVVKIGAGTIAKKAGDANHTVIGYGVESETNGVAGVALAAATIDTACDSPIIQTVGAVAFDAACVFKGNKPTAAGGGAVTGLPG